jgi:hypothetical protein
LGKTFRPFGRQKVPDMGVIGGKIPGLLSLRHWAIGIKADRLSCQKFIVNQFRLFLSQAAYILLLGIRQAAQGTRLAKATVSRLKETLKYLSKINYTYLTTSCLLPIFTRKLILHDYLLKLRQKLVFRSEKY